VASEETIQRMSIGLPEEFHVLKRDHEQQVSSFMAHNASKTETKSKPR
jgi:hypothetical protein